MEKIPKLILDEYLNFLQPSYKNSPALLENKSWKLTNFLARTTFILDISDSGDGERPAKCLNLSEPSVHLNITLF